MNPRKSPSFAPKTEFAPLLLTTDPVTFSSASGFLVCLGCGNICIGFNHLFRVIREDYRVLRIETIKTGHTFKVKNARFVPAPDMQDDSLVIQFNCHLDHSWWLEMGNHKGIIRCAVHYDSSNLPTRPELT